MDYMIPYDMEYNKPLDLLFDSLRNRQHRSIPSKIRILVKSLTQNNNHWNNITSHIFVITYKFFLTTIETTVGSLEIVASERCIFQ